MFRGGTTAVNARMALSSTVGQVLTKAAASFRPVRTRLTAALLPPTCCLCGNRGRDPDLDICDVCLTLLPRHDRGATAGGAMRTRDLGEPAEAGLRLVVVPFLYAYPVAHLIRALKFRGERSHARVLGRLLAEARGQIDASLPDCVVPVPLHVSRYRERGYNQSHELARFAGACLGVRVESRCLVRAVATREQSGLTLTERHRNVRGAFRLIRRPQAHRVALVDDVLTTGSTIREAADVLRRAGVAEIEFWAVARAVLR